MAQRDQFADLLSSFSGTRKNDLSKLSLAERQRQGGTGTGNGTGNGSAQLNSSWSGLDLLGSAGAASGTSGASGASGNTNGINSSSASLVTRNEFDFFGDASVSSTSVPGTGASPSSTPLRTQATADSSHSNGNGHWDDIFGTATGSGGIQSAPPPATAHNNNLFDDDEFTDAFVADDTVAAPTPAAPAAHAAPTAATAPESTRTVPAPAESEMYKRDEALSELMEMGFELDVAKRALRQTQNYDINEAISVIMHEAHAKSAQQAKKPRDRDHRQWDADPTDDLSAAMQEFTVDLRSKAFGLLSKGRKTLAKGIEMYKEQQFQSNDNQPVWMRNQASYKQQSMALEGDDHDTEFDRDQMRQIVERQRAYDRQLRREKEARAKLERQNAASPGQQQQQQQQQQVRSKYDEPPRRPTSSKFETPTPRPSRPSRTQSASKFDEPVSRNSRSRMSPATPVAAPVAESVAAPVAEPEPFDIFNSPVPGESNSQSSHSSQAPRIPDVAMSSFQMDSFQDSRNQGNDFFKRGDFTSALLKYQDSLQSLPPGHKLRVLTLSNISNAQFKLGNSKECLGSIDEALALIGGFQLQLGQYSEVELDTNKSLKSIWLKLISRKAETLEHMEKFKDALANYNLCIENGGSTKAVLDGKSRVLKVLQPAAAKKPAAVKPVRAAAAAAAASAAPVSNEALQHVQRQSRQKEAEEAQKFELHDQVDAKIQQWRLGKEDNLRALLASLHEVLWPEANWKPVTMTDLVLDKKVKLNYLKAVAKTHPDKLAVDCSVEQKMIAQNVFVTLNQSWDKFKQVNGIN